MGYPFAKYRVKGASWLVHWYSPLLLRAAPKPQERSLAGAAAAAAAAAALKKALDLGMEVLDSIMDDYQENEAMVCYWNDWAARDQFARIHRTFNYGRQSRVKTTLGIPNGRWYCAYKQAAMAELGLPLDPN